MSTTSREARLARHQREWDQIAEQDAYWAVLSEPERKFGNWDPDAFFATGERDVALLMAQAERLGRPVGRASALDFGCGVGRLTRALGERFDTAIGVDISGTMINRARELHADHPSCRFEVNAAPSLPFSEGAFDLVYTRMVLQHLPNQATIERMLGEFMRVLRPDGLLAFQLPSELPAFVRIQPRRRAYLALRRLGVAPARLYWRLGLHPMRMLAIPTPRVLDVLRAAGGRALDVQTQRHPDFGFKDTTYYVVGAADAEPLIGETR